MNIYFFLTLMITIIHRGFYMIDIKIGKGNVISWVASEVERDMVGLLEYQSKLFVNKKK